VTALRFSIIASIVLTVALNVALRLFPKTARRLHERIAQRAERMAYDQPSGSNVRVIFPWKAMLIGSLLLTLLINAVLLARR
jgi:hypothetical protein